VQAAHSTASTRHAAERTFRCLGILTPCLGILTPCLGILTPCLGIFPIMR
jgi:hypothetical protein